jgi:uncharacterized membrane protein YdjX (TVP38/TMEM64 family)
MFKRYDMHLIVQQAQLLSLAAIAVSVSILYITVSGFRSETSQAISVLSAGNSVALREYLLSFGSWAPLVSLLLMVLQALIAPIPAFLTVFANGLVFGVFWGWMLSLAGQALAAVICFGSHVRSAAHRRKRSRVSSESAPPLAGSDVGARSGFCFCG